MILVIGAILGFISVAFGAYAEHGLHGSISDEHFDMLMTALRYNQIYAIVISAIGLVVLSTSNLSNSIILKISSYFFLLGTLLFSFGIYTFVIFGIPQALRLAPIGGTILMLGWLSLVVVGVLYKKPSKQK